ncbi:MAG TPA: DUF423 domain-containing protein [Gemmatimonadales bacterium]|nr:DUF423 domain-containing protein [Gemmatimonadales bacterium]
MTARIAGLIGTLLAGTAVAAGAFGAHALRARLEPRDLEIFETAARYQMYHGLALIAVAWLITQGTGASAAGWAFTLGTALFSGSLYLMVFTGARWLGAVTPLGGVAFLVGWALTGLAVMRLKG